MNRLQISVYLLVVGCGSTRYTDFVPSDAGFGDGGPTTGTPIDLGVSDLPTLTLDLQNDVGGPEIMILTPAENGEVHYDTLTVTAKIVSPMGGSRISSPTVQIIIPTTSATGLETATMTLTAVADVYSGQIDISDIPSGPSMFSVVAEDIDGKKGSATRNYIHDHGPTITFVLPSAPTAKGSTNVELIADDPLHPLTDPSLVRVTVGETPIPVTQVVGAVPLRVTGLIDFNAFSPPLDGPQLITAIATSPAGTTGRATKQFIVDNSGPKIEFVNPVPGQFVGGILNIDVKLSDISGIDESSAVAIFGNDPTKKVTLNKGGLGDYFGTFDVHSLGQHYIYPAFSVRVDDKLGNHAELGIEILVDNTPPAISMDPPSQRTVVYLPNDVRKCSNLWDPVGTDTMNDGDIVQQIMTVRARVEDHGNLAPGLIVERYAGLDDNSVKIYATPVSNGPLVVDTDEDGTCDDINPLLLPTSNVQASNQAISLQLTAITPNGNLDYRSNINLAPWNSTCSQVGESAGVQPVALCALAGTTLFYATSYGPFADPAVWTIPPITGAVTDCVGIQFDSANKLPEGPTCFATIARDVVDNHNVSEPVRVCIDRGGGLCSSWSRITLSDSCSGVYHKATNTIEAGVRCTPALRAPPYDSCSDGKRVGSHCYKYFSSVATWAAAEAGCQTWGGSLAHLASVMTAGVGFPRYTANENAAIREFSGDDKWLGLVGNNYWTDGEFPRLTNWAASEPASLSDCAVQSASTGTWYTDPCTNTRPYVCKRPISNMYPVPEIRTIR